MPDYIYLRQNNAEISQVIMRSPPHCKPDRGKEKVTHRYTIEPYFDFLGWGYVLI